MSQFYHLITATTHTLPFDKPSPRDFERLWRVQATRSFGPHSFQAGLESDHSGPWLVAQQEVRAAHRRHRLGRLLVPGGTARTIPRTTSRSRAVVALAKALYRPLSWR